jgi:Glycosyl transferases group 1
MSASNMRSKLSILIIPGIFPFPPDDGGRICTYGFLEYLSRNNDVHLLLQAQSLEQESQIVKFRKELKNVTIHSTSCYEEPASPNVGTIARRYSRRLVKRMLGIGDKPMQITQTNYLSNRYFMVPFFPHSEQFIAHLHSLLRKYRFDIVQTEFTPMLNLITVIPNTVKRVFVEVESWHLRLRDEASYAGENPQYIAYVSANAKLIEAAFMRDYDGVVAFNAVDAQYLRETLPEVQVFDSPFPVLDKDVNPVTPKNPVTINKVVFVGAEQHFPNYDGLKWFVADILPKIRLANKIKFVVVGIWSHRTVKELLRINSSIVFCGYLEDLKPVFENSISVVPIRIGGGGLRAKIIYAMANNSVVISTSIAAVGLTKQVNKSILIADSAKEFINTINRVLENGLDVHDILIDAKRQVIERFSQEAAGRVRERCYHAILEQDAIS